MLNYIAHYEDVSGNFSVYLNCAFIYPQYMHMPGATNSVTSSDPISSF